MRIAVSLARITGIEYTKRQVWKRTCRSSHRGGIFDMLVNRQQAVSGQRVHWEQNSFSNFDMKNSMWNF